MTLERVIALIEVIELNLLVNKMQSRDKKKYSIKAKKRNANIYSVIVSKATIVYLGIK